MSSIKLLIGVFILLFSIFNLSAQDKLIKTNNDTVLCVIKEIGDLEIKYTCPDVSENILFGIDKSNVVSIILANGNVLTFTTALKDPDNYASNHRNALKVNFLSPLFNSFNVVYERSLRPGRSVETALGIIGMGNDLYDTDEQGVFLKLGYKFIKSPDYYIRGQRYAHILKGTYIRPELAMSYYSYDNIAYDWYSDTESSTREDNLMFALLLNFGKQWVIDNAFIVDSFIGIGYGFGDDKGSYGLHKAFIGGVDEFPIALSMGIRVGWCF